METKPYGYSVKLRDDGKYDLSFLYEDCKFVHPYHFKSADKASTVGRSLENFDFKRYHIEGTKFMYSAFDDCDEYSTQIGETEQDALDNLANYLVENGDPTDYSLNPDVEYDEFLEAVELAMKTRTSVSVDRVFDGTAFDIQSGIDMDTFYDRVIDNMCNQYHDSDVDCIDDEYRGFVRYAKELTSEDHMLRCEFRRLYAHHINGGNLEGLWIDVALCPPERFIKMEK